VGECTRPLVREVISALHFKADLTLGLGSVAFDYLAK
jgi:acetoacetate decarboxylase